MLRPIYVYLADDGHVIPLKGGYLWHWDVPEEGEEFVPEEGAADFFRGCGREDIAALVETYERNRA